ncbi:hypothetical protein [Nitrospina watsonii]|uniref:Fn3_3 domain-containing protein n=1 Tax=Nitrospina watsonii TaxID=1323948 RepID=A0ABN8W1T7_9BACT|nr:hypothetical protein [Nitrospina watsonii]CAI2718530.1 fn3_3 domain-containing protein [Nitrospina watsonii]
MFKGLFLTFSLFAMVGTSYAGSLHGTVTFSGTPPPPTIHKTGKYRKACGPEFSSQALLLHGQKVQNGVVWLTEKKGKALTQAPITGDFKLDQKNCRYSPHIVAMPRGAELQILSSDPINHNIHTYSFDNDPINLMFLPGQEYVQEFEEAEIVKIECDLHSWMQAWIVVTPNPYYAVTPESGSFVIEDIPSGSYTLNVWHEVLGTQSRKVEIDAEDHEINFDFSELAEQVSQNQ